METTTLRIFRSPIPFVWKWTNIDQNYPVHRSSPFIEIPLIQIHNKFEWSIEKWNLPNPTLVGIRKLVLICKLSN